MQTHTRTIFHIDVNSAFLSWESIERLRTGIDSIDLRGIASAIGGSRSNRHGIILAKSSLAKQYHVTTGEPIQQALNKCPSLVIVPPHHDLYAKRSKEFIDLLRNYSDTLQQVSIDEAYLDMTHTLSLLGGDPVSIADHIRKQIYEKLGFTVNVGISENKLLAKMASDFEKPDRTHTLWPKEIPVKMWPLPVKNLFFVGRSASATFKKLGIHTIGDLAHANLDIIQSHLGVKYGETIYNYANGISFSEVAEPEVANKGIGNSITLAKDLTDYESAFQVLLSLAETVGARLRQHHYNCQNVAIEIKDWDFRRTTHQLTLSEPTNNTQLLYKTACALFQQHWNHIPVRLLGIRTGKLTDSSYEQLSFFDSAQSQKQKKLDSAIDSIRARFGTDAIQRASFLQEQSVTTHMQKKSH